ncbi:MAG TPA: fused MFS/spermidine synthase [Anaerolineae bacterium]|nr:fused MFS/spermidine synthase [Anaerolineae bacterium]
MSRRYLYLTVFTSGLVTLAVELSASRLIEPYFGTSNLIWATLIGLILLYLSAGYALGGRWADRSPRADVLYRIIVWAAFLIGLIPFVAHPILSLAVTGFADFNAALLAGSFIAVLILFSAPITLLGCVSPFAIRLAVDDVAHTGNVSGRVYAVSTVGSFFGAFLPVLILIPAIGTRSTFVTLSLALMAAGLIGLRRRAIRFAWMPIAILLLAALVQPDIKSTAGTIFQTESSYNYIQVVERGDTRYLLLNEGQGVHSVYNPNRVDTGGTWDFFALAPYFNVPATADRLQRVAVVGLAAGTIPRQYSAIFGPVPIDGIEIDPRIVEAGRAYFDMSLPNLNVAVADGRFALSRSPYRYDVVGVDAYRLPYIPWHLTTVEFFREVREHLTDAGVVVINVGHAGNDYRLVDALTATLSQVFPSVHVADVPNTFNTIVYATAQPTSPENLRANLASMTHPLARNAAERALPSLRAPSPGGAIFTDDRAPVEQLTNSIMVNYLLGIASGEITLP